MAISNPRRGYRAGLLLAGLGLLAGIGTLLPIAAKGTQGVTLLYLSGFIHIPLFVVMTLAPFVIAPVSVILGLLLAAGRLRSYAPWYMGCGLPGAAFTMLGVVEGMEHIRAFLDGCSALRFAAADPAPIAIGSGGLLAVAAYGGMIATGLWRPR